MALVSAAGSGRKRRPPSSTASRKNAGPKRNGGWSVVFSLVTLVFGAAVVYGILQFHATYAVTWQSPVKVRFEWPLVVAHRTETPDAYAAQIDQRHPLTAYQQYACHKFG